MYPTVIAREGNGIYNMRWIDAAVKINRKFTNYLLGDFTYFIVESKKLELFF